MAISAQSLQHKFARESTYQPQELSPHRYCQEPRSNENNSATTRALLNEYYNFLNTFTSLGIVQGFDVIERVDKAATKEGIRDEYGHMWENFLGENLYHRNRNCVPLPVQAELAADLFIGFSIRNVLESDKKFQDEADLLVEVGASINQHLSKLHFGKYLEDNNVSKLIYDYFAESPEKFALLSSRLTQRLNRLGINPMIANIRIGFNEEHKNLSWSFFDSGVRAKYTVKYSPNGDHSVCAVCGVDGSGKSTLLDKLGMVVLPIAHPDDPRMVTFFKAFGEGIIKDYEREVELFKSMRSGPLKKDLTLTAFRFVRNLLAHLDSRYSPLTIFQNVVLDRSSLTNIAYVNNPRKFGEAVTEFVMDNFLNPRRIAVIDTPISISYYRATQGRGGTDEFDEAEFNTYVTRATMYRILVNTLPNVVALNTYDAEREEVKSPEVLAKELKRVLFEN